MPFKTLFSQGGAIAPSGKIAILLCAAVALSACEMISKSLEKTTETPSKPSVITMIAALPKPEEKPLETAKGHYKVGAPYQINGKWYYPSLDYGYRESGVASWYGPQFHGRKTANGEIFDMNRVSAAHRTLPLPSMVQVTNLENGRSMKIRVNDRGPYARNRIIDLSQRAAELLGFQNKGTALVEVEILEAESRLLALDAQSGGSAQENLRDPTIAATTGVDAEDISPPEGASAAPERKPDPNSAIRAIDAPRPLPDAPPESEESYKLVDVDAAPGIYVQVGAFSRLKNALIIRKRLYESGTPGARIEQITRGGNILFRVRLGPLASVPQADALAAQIMKSTYPDAVVIVDYPETES